MLYRNNKYEWLIVGGRRHHPKLGDLKELQVDIKQSLPNFKKAFETFNEDLFGDTD
tara:strand:- start:82 stop:249 length:168 start_codon:yes stop_codon:yes gene_type:complete